MKAKHYIGGQWIEVDVREHRDFDPDQFAKSRGLPTYSELMTQHAEVLMVCAALRDALQYLYDETTDYIEINKLGAHNNQSMKIARAALSLAEIKR